MDALDLQHDCDLLLFNNISHTKSIFTYLQPDLYWLNWLSPEESANNRKGGEEKGEERPVRLFHDDTFKGFFRRLAWSIDGTSDCFCLLTSVQDPWHFDSGLDPWIRTLDDNPDPYLALFVSGFLDGNKIFLPFFKVFWLLLLCRWLQLAQLAKGKKSRP
jgi:hypothetical protein